MNTFRGLIPDDSIVIRRELANCHSWEINTQPMTIWQWRGIVKKIRDEFGDNIMNIYHPDERVKMTDIEKDEKGYIIGFRFSRDVSETRIVGGKFFIYLKKQI